MHGHKSGWEESGKEYRSLCPKCQRMAFFWNVRKNTGWCFACETPFFHRPSEVEGYHDDTHYVEEININDSDITYQFEEPNQEIKNYLNSRRICADKYYVFRYKNNTIYFPVESPSPEFIQGWIYRKIDNKFYSSCFGLRKKTGGYVFGLSKLTRNNNYITITEGPFDILSPGLFGYGISLLGTELFETTEYWLARNFDKILFWLDPDAEKKAIKYADKFAKIYNKQTAAVINHEHDPGDCMCYEFINAMKAGEWELCQQHLYIPMVV